jgi:(1->4)-alpha-D-glucan 1-alpha-D-glucosylmutase
MEAPDPGEEYLLYQTLLGTWPVQPSGEPEPVATAEYIERIQVYMAKALHEAKLNTSWIQPNELWDTAMRNFVANILESSSRNKFLPNFLPVVREIAQLGAINSLSQTLLKLTSPGLPDIYQGTEIWDYSLVDPDNRRPVDYKHRAQLLESLSHAKPEELWQTWPDGRIKLFLIQRALKFRRDNSDLFQRGEYLPLRAAGSLADCCVSFARKLEDRRIVIIAPRLSSRVGFPPIGERWHDTVVDLPESISGTSARDLFTGREIGTQNRQIKIADAMSVLPFAALSS